MGIWLCEQNFRDVWRRNKSVRAEIGKILRTHTAKLVVRMSRRSAIVSPASERVRPTMTVCVRECARVCAVVRPCMRAYVMCLQYTMIIFYPG